jgi:NAD(P)-dependent dehydrogenase (short-subunit alcohol dehydrogenase family)
MDNAVVTGTSSGIGYAVSLHLARKGYRVFAGMRNLSKAAPLEEAAAAESLPVEVVDFLSSFHLTSPCGLVVKTQTLDPEVPGSSLAVRFFLILFLISMLIPR